VLRPRPPARPRPARSASCSGPAAPAARPGTPGTRAAAPRTRTRHQTAPHTPPKDPAPQDTAGVPSSRTPEHITTLPPGIPQTRAMVNKLPLAAGDVGGFDRAVFSAAPRGMAGTGRPTGPSGC
jgi:hypothetical protein